MFKSIKNLSKAVTEITTVAAKEVCHQVSSANECSTNFTAKVAWKAGQVRKAYEEKLSQRQRKTLMIEHVQEENTDK